MVGVRFPKAEADRLRAEAAAGGMPISEVVRRWVGHGRLRASERATRPANAERTPFR